MDDFVRSLELRCLAVQPEGSDVLESETALFQQAVTKFQPSVSPVVAIIGAQGLRALIVLLGIGLYLWGLKGFWDWARIWLLARPSPRPTITPPAVGQDARPDVMGRWYILLSLSVAGMGNVLHLLFTIDGISMLATRHPIVSGAVGRAIGWMILDLGAAVHGKTQLQPVGVALLVFFMLPTLLTALTWTGMAVAKTAGLLKGFFTSAPDPSAARIAKSLSAQLGIRAPVIRVRNVDFPFLEIKVPWFPGQSRIHLSQAVMLQLSPSEARAAIAHELGHIKYDASTIRLTRWLSFLLLFPCNVFAVILDTGRRETRADTVAARLVGNADTVAAALVKVSLGGIFGLGQKNRGTGTEQTVCPQVGPMASLAILASLLQPELILGYAHPLLHDRLEALAHDDGAQG